MDVHLKNALGFESRLKLKTLLAINKYFYLWMSSNFRHLILFIQIDLARGLNHLPQ